MISRQREIDLEEYPEIKKKIGELENTYPFLNELIPIRELLLWSPISRARDVPRPQNSFILFRKYFGRREGCNGTFAELSKKAAEAWKNEDKTTWQQLAQIAKDIHHQVHIDYRYKPRRLRRPYKKKPIDIQSSGDDDPKKSQVDAEYLEMLQPSFNGNKSSEPSVNDTINKSHDHTEYFETSQPSLNHEMSSAPPLMNDNTNQTMIDKTISTETISQDIMNQMQDIIEHEKEVVSKFQDGFRNIIAAMERLRQDEKESVLNFQYHCKHIIDKIPLFSQFVAQ